jgi:glyoxylase-like metal-dependent hydrolase (beta-lactamase superfamily II)
MKVDLVLAPNPSLFTGPGTNTWIVSDDGEAVVIDPGPVIAEHREATLAALGGLDPVAVLVTHTHPDHAPAANALATELGVPTVARMDGPEFTADRTVAEGDTVEVGGLVVEVMATPGHTPDSTCFRIGDRLFTGDHVMGGSTVIVDDMADYLASLRRLLGIGLKTINPGHGPVIEDAEGIVSEYLEHRLERERQIVDAVEDGAATVGAVVARVYRDVDPSLHPAAAISVDAHLRKLAAEGRVAYGDGDDAWGRTVVPA